MDGPQTGQSAGLADAVHLLNRIGRRFGRRDRDRPDAGVCACQCFLEAVISIVGTLVVLDDDAGKLGGVGAAWGDVARNRRRFAGQSDDGRDIGPL